MRNIDDFESGIEKSLVEEITLTGEKNAKSLLFSLNKENERSIQEFNRSIS